MEDVKRWFTSKTIIAAALGMLITVAQLLGFDQLTGIDKDTVAQHVVNVAEGVLYLAAIVGRLSAKHKLT